MAKTLFTPVGKAEYPHIFKPGEYQGKPKKQLETNLLVSTSNPKVETMINGIKETVEKWIEANPVEVKDILKKGKAKKMSSNIQDYVDYPFEEHDPEDEDCTVPLGYVRFKFKTIYSWVDKKTSQTKYNKILIINKDNEVIENDPGVFSGTEMICSYTLECNASGVEVTRIRGKMKLQGVKIFKLGEGFSKLSAEDFPDEEGYEDVEAVKSGVAPAVVDGENVDNEDSVDPFGTTDASTGEDEDV